MNEHSTLIDSLKSLQQNEGWKNLMSLLSKDIEALEQRIFGKEDGYEALIDARNSLKQLPNLPNKYIDELSNDSEQELDVYE